MADFAQTRHITTIHRLGTDRLEHIERKLSEYSKQRPIALVLPSLYSELQGEALQTIVEILKQVDYINEIVITMAGMDEGKFNHAKEFFSQLPQRHNIIWNDGPRIGEIYKYLEEKGKHVGQNGKGRSAWLAYGYVIARDRSKVIALHDCDIVTYDREMLARLCLPVTDPDSENRFCKGYYSRVSENKINGRTTRLLVSPFIWALKEVLQAQNITSVQKMLEYFDEFRYPLAGEFSMAVDLARMNKIPSDWGLEIGVLQQVYSNAGAKYVCQAQIADYYEHKHQQLGEEPDKGLYRMAVDIVKRFYSILAKEGVVLDKNLFHTLVYTYQHQAQKAIKKFSTDAKYNVLEYDRSQEEHIVETFMKAIRIAGEHYLKDEGIAEIPNWNSVANSVEDIFPRLIEAVKQDMGK